MTLSGTADSAREQWLMEGIEVDAVPCMDQRGFLERAAMMGDSAAEHAEEADVDLDANDCCCKRCGVMLVNEDIHYIV